MNIQINKNLFLAYCGMIFAGYDLMDRTDELVDEICAVLETVTIDESLRAYFSYTRTDEIKVNPYYPRGSELSSACFFIDKSLEVYIQFLRACNAREAEDREFLNWIAKLPCILKKIDDNQDIQLLWQRYQNEMKARFISVSYEITQLQKKVDDLNWGMSPKIVFAPNILQAKALADFALVDEVLYVIAAKFSKQATIHEYLHVIFEKIRPVIVKILQQREIRNFVDVEKMFTIGYMTDMSEESQVHALEDCLIRAISGMLDTTIDLTEFSKSNVECGFTSVPELIHRLQYRSLKGKTLTKVLEDIL